MTSDHTRGNASAGGAHPGRRCDSSSAPSRSRAARAPIAAVGPTGAADPAGGAVEPSRPGGAVRSCGGTPWERAGPEVVLPRPPLRKRGRRASLPLRPRSSVERAQVS